MNYQGSFPGATPLVHIQLEIHENWLEPLPTGGCALEEFSRLGRPGRERLTSRLILHQNQLLTRVPS